MSSTLLPQFVGVVPSSAGDVDSLGAAAQAAFDTAKDKGAEPFAVCVVLFAPDDEIPDPFYGRRLVSVRGAFVTSPHCDLGIETMAAAVADSMTRNPWEGPADG